ncbi:MAG: response regulator [bacterium]
MTIINQVQLEKLFQLAGVIKPDNITAEDINRVVVELEKKINPHTEEKSLLCLNQKAYVLIVDDLELSLHQLSLLLTKCGYTVHIARSKEEALDKYQKHGYDYVLLDLFLPEPDEGIELLKSIVLLEKTITDNTKVIMISGTDSNELVQKCYQSGASEFVKKDAEWHKNILRHLRQIDSEKSGAISDFYIDIVDEEKKLAYIRAKNLTKTAVRQELQKEILTLTNRGLSNIVLDMKDIAKIDSQGIELIVFAYKLCTEAKGSFMLCNVSGAVNQAFSYVFLNNVISIFRGKEDAFNSFK